MFQVWIWPLFFANDGTSVEKLLLSSTLAGDRGAFRGLWQRVPERQSHL